MVNKTSEHNKPDVERKRRQEIANTQENRGNASQEETGGPGAEAKQRNQEADGQRQQGREHDKDNQRR